MHANALKISLNTPPVDGRANDALRRFIAKELHVPASRVSLLRGEKARSKLLFIQGITEQNAAECLARAGVFAIPTSEPPSKET